MSFFNVIVYIAKITIDTELQLVTCRDYSLCKPMNHPRLRYNFVTYQLLQQGYPHFLWNNFHAKKISQLQISEQKVDWLLDEKLPELYYDCFGRKFIPQVAEIWGCEQLKAGRTMSLSFLVAMGNSLQ